ncbi:type IV pilus assembly protein PilM [bacterium]|nr:type IV pilus assembly protein PilM [bacterium]UNM08921.1 MAG: type IV pilus assembly protein PilM [Planctomycetales bacterium]
MAQGAAKKYDVGLDLTSNELRCTAISRKGKEMILERFAVGEIPSSVFAAGRVAEPGQLGNRIKEILKENGIVARRAIISLSGKAAITRIIELPKMGAAQTRQAISLQINQYVPFPPGDTVYDYKVLPAREGANPAMQEVLLVATRATTVDSLIATMRSAGIECEGIKITSLAAWNLIESSMEGYTSAVGLIDMRDTVTDLSFFLKGQFRLSRPVELGYNNILAKVGQLLGVSAQEAEEYLKADPVDLTIPEDEIDPTEDNRLREALLSVFSGFVSELIRSIRYYESQAQRTERVGKMLLFGSGTIFPNLAKYLEDQTGLEVTDLSLSSMLQYRQGTYSLEHLNQEASKLPVAAGLCLEHFRKKKSLNLMPPSYYTKAINKQIAAIGVVILLAIGFWYYSIDKDLNGKINTLNGEVQQREGEAARLKPAADDFDANKNDIIAQRPKFNQIFSLFKEQRIWPEIMDEVGNRINDRVWLDQIDFEASTNTVTMEGVAVDRVDIYQFLINLDRSPYFTNTGVSENADTGGAGGAGGGGGSGGGGSSGPIGRGISSSPGPGTSTTSVAAPAQSGTRPMQDYKLPRGSFQPGASIEDFFQRDFTETSTIQWKFEVTTDLQNEIVNQEAAVQDIIQIEEVIDDVVST